MNRREKRKLRGKLIKYFPLIIFIFLSGLAGWLYVKSVDEKIQNPVTKNAEQYTYDKYYVAVTGYTNALENITLDELTKREIFVKDADKENILKIYSSSDEFSTSSNNNTKISADPIDELIDNQSKIAVLPFNEVDYRVKTLSVDGKNIWDKSVKDYPLKLKVKTEKEPSSEEKFDPLKITLMTNVGDVILGRTVARKMSDYNDWTHPWLKMADHLKKADITFADLEIPLSDRVAPSYQGMSFITPQKTIEGFKMSGIDIVALANNHSTNYGTDVFRDTLEVLKNNNIKYVGGGENLEEAERLQIVERNGVKFGFLSYNSIIGAINATDETPGVANFDIKPWSDVDSAEDIEKIKKAVSNAKNEADVVVVGLHWGVEYEPDPIDSQVKVAHEAIDAGADLIVGTHPHVVQGIESYKNKFIIYSLGNFIFDQEWSVETTQGTICNTYFYGKKLVASPLVPYQIYDFNQPNFVGSDIQKTILGRVFNASLSREFKN